MKLRKPKSRIVQLHTAEELQWNSTAWPTIYLLDAKGVIHYKNICSEKLDEAVDKLLQEMAQK